ncbi:MAG: hypothetical protein EPN17_16540 [Methylobacter sp.]|nr:MAG: hypothetical protein EPN17_16540 [Methylobacter sp.]
MTEKTASKYLLNLEKHFAAGNPVLLKASKVFQELDQIEYDLGLIEMDETTASKNSWWPIISLIGGNSTAKSRFINNYLGSDELFSGIQTSSHKFTVLLHNNQSSPTTLPGTALDVDHRFPFYQISRKIEQQQEGEGDRINSYLELKTLNSDRLKNKLFIDAPNISAAPSSPVMSLLTKHIVENSDLALIFVDVFDSTAPLVDELIENIILHQDSNRFVYLIDKPAAMLNSATNSEIISSWQRKLAGLGLNTGQFIVLSSQEGGSSQNPADFAAIDQRIANVGYDRTYRVLNSVEKNIREINNVVMPEVKKAILQWKDRSAFSSLIVLGFIATVAIFAEIQTGILEFLIDPIIGPAIVLTLIGIMTPLHIIFSKLQAKLIISQLNARQKELHLMENLAGIFEKNLTFSRMMLPISEPIGWNKKTKLRLTQTSNKTKELVQLLNDNFSTYDGLSLTGHLDSTDFK